MNSPAMADTKDSALGVALAWVAAVNRQDIDGIVNSFATNPSFFGTTTKTLISDAEGIRQYFANVFQAYAPVKVELGQIRIVSFHRSTMPN